MTEKDLRQDIVDELDFEPSVNAAHIGVSVDNGVVTLTGHVSTYAEKIAAERAVRRVRGVRAIAQEIEVRRSSDAAPPDEELARRALNLLRWDSLLPRDGIQLTVRGGWITLTGQVEWHYQKQAAEDHIRRLDGVAGVFNELTIKPRVEVSDLKRKIEDALKRNAEIEARGIRVTVRDGGRILLEGKVHHWDERDAVETAAWSAAGVQNVEDKLTIA